MTRLPFLTAAVLLFASGSLLHGHSGRTDANGGHYDRKTGSYHYHNAGHAVAPPMRVQVPSSSARPRRERPEKPVEKTVQPRPKFQTRTWHDIKGEVLLTAALKNANKAKYTVTLARADGTVKDVSLDLLSVADRAFALTHNDKKSEFQRPTRKWTSANGKYQVSAEALIVEDDAIRLLRSDNQNVISVSPEKLSLDDRAYIDRLEQTIKRPDEAHLASEPVTDAFSSVEAFTGVDVAKSNHQLQENSSDNPIPAGDVKKARAASPPVPPRTENTAPISNSGITADRTPTGLPIYTGPRGGRYHYSKSGKKVYEKTR